VRKKPTGPACFRFSRSPSRPRDLPRGLGATRGKLTPTRGKQTGQGKNPREGDTYLNTGEEDTLSWRGSRDRGGGEGGQFQLKKLWRRWVEENTQKKNTNTVEKGKAHNGR